MFDKERMSTGFADRVVHVSLPAEVAFDLDSFSKIQRDILGRLGCQACCSGWDIRWDIARRFMIDEQLNVRPVGMEQLGR